MSKLELEQEALRAFEASGLQQNKKNWDAYKSAFVQGYMFQQKNIRIKLDVAIGHLDKMIESLN